MSFWCHKCGFCCRCIGHIVAQGLQEDYAFTPLENGSCPHLTEDNTCAIYETRPNLCRVEKYGEKSGLPVVDWIRKSEEGCKLLMRHFGMSDKEIEKVYEGKPLTSVPSTQDNINEESKSE